MGCSFGLQLIFFDRELFWEEGGGEEEIGRIGEV